MNFIDKEDFLRPLYTNDLRSYVSTSLIDDALFYPVIDRCLSTLKIKTQVFKSELIKVRNFKGELPDDFFKVKSVVRCESHTFKYTNPSIQVDYEPVLCRERPCEAPLINCDGSKYYLNQRFESYNIELQNIVPLSVHKSSKDCCSSGFQNLSNDFITIENGYMNTEFREGTVYLVYESIENDGMIPDYPKLTEAIKTLCIYEAFKVMFLNGEMDIVSRLQYIEPKAAIAENIIKSIAKEQSFQQILNFKSSMVARYNVFDRLTQFKTRY